MPTNWPEDGVDMDGPPVSETYDAEGMRRLSGHGMEKVEAELEELVEVDVICSRRGMPPNPTLRRLPVSCSLLVVAPSLSLLVLYSSFR